MRILIICFLINLTLLTACGNKTESEKGIGGVTELPDLPALLASRYGTLDEFKKVVNVHYDTKYTPDDSIRSGSVTLTYKLNGYECVSQLKSGISQNDIIKVRDGKPADAMHLLLNCPFAVANRVELNRIYKLARRRPVLFGEGDVAFFDLALASVDNIFESDRTYLTERDSSEKGYLNTFNHITAQAFITSIYSKEMADFVADVHERKNMPELIYGNFTSDQLLNLDNNPVDNYVDLINNELGQTLGDLLRKKYNITYETEWTAELLVNYLNDIQLYYSRSFGIGMEPFRSQDEVVSKIIKKLNKSNGRLSYHDA